MGDLSWLIALIGIIVVLVIICDIILTVLHVDTDGPVAWAVFQIIWRSCMKVIRRFPSLRRSIVAMAGPLMIVVTLAVWINLFIIGFALIYWPYLDFFILRMNILRRDLFMPFISVALQPLFSGMAISCH